MPTGWTARPPPVCRAGLCSRTVSSSKHVCRLYTLHWGHIEGVCATPHLTAVWTTCSAGCNVCPPQVWAASDPSPGQLAAQPQRPAAWPAMRGDVPPLRSAAGLSGAWGLFRFEG